MDAKEKAKELFDKFRNIKDSQSSCGGNLMFTPEAKQCALICVDEVLGYMGADRGYAFWVEVKIEIEKL